MGKFQGNGHERDFTLHRDVVFIFDMYNCQIYPYDSKAKCKQRNHLHPTFPVGISRRIELESGCTDDRYLRLLRDNLPECLDEFQPDFVLFNAGTDCLRGDPLGNMELTENVRGDGQLMIARA